MCTDIGEVGVVFLLSDFTYISLSEKTTLINHEFLPPLRCINRTATLPSYSECVKPFGESIMHPMNQFTDRQLQYQSVRGADHSFGQHVTIYEKTSCGERSTTHHFGTRSILIYGMLCASRAKFFARATDHMISLTL